MQERRHAERLNLNLPVRWESLLTHGRGTVCDLSGSGCFLLSARAARAGELIRLEIDFGNQLVFAWGKIVYAVEEMGFALQFIFSEENEARALRKLIERMRQQAFDTTATLS
jgi:PilZ domain-containing protein